MTVVQAHGDIHKRILKVSDEIVKSPDSAYLYFKRGKLYYQHEQNNKSLQDLKTSENLNHSSVDLQLQFAKTYLKLSMYRNSIAYCTEILQEHPQHVRAYKLLAQNHYQLGSYRESAQNYNKVIEFSKKTLPENYVDASLAWEKLNSKDGFIKAEAIMREGIQTLGKLISLYTRLRELALIQEDYSKAIDVQLEIVGIVQRKEFAYFKLSELYRINNNKSLAIESLENAETAIKKLPQRLQNTSFINDLKSNIKSTEAELLNN